MPWLISMLVIVILAIYATPWFWLLAVVMFIWKLTEPPEWRRGPAPPPLRHHSSSSRVRGH